MKRYLYIIIALAIVACQKDDLGIPDLTPEQLSLIGKAVNFNATTVDEFKQQTRTTYNDTGVFNEDDLMRIFRQYYNTNTSAPNTWSEESYRTYRFNTKYATGTSISLSRDWRVYKDRKGANWDSEHNQLGDPFDQEDSDSITWEHGGTVRFRAWTRSNYAGCLSGCYKYNGEYGITNYYPDFCASEWATVSGPTEQIPLTLHHVCSRIAISYRNNGSQFYKVEVATEWEDYKRADNADTNDHDNSTTEAAKRDDDAKAECKLVTDAYNRMCMPAGVDIHNSSLYAMKKSFWSPLDNNDTDNSKLRKLEEENSSNFYYYGTNTPEYIQNNVQRPVFANVNQSCYLITIPYDMSNATTKGDVITLPACTRFRVYMRDVNNGDGNHTGGYEGTYHIFSLQDITDGDGNPAFPDGLQMLPGYSYKFYVGYRYDRLTVTAADNFSWTQQDLEAEDMNPDVHTVPEPTPANYTWWKETIADAIPTSSGGDFNPQFHIKTQQQFLEFINLVNGTAATLTSGLNRAKRNVVNEDHKNNAYDKYYWWYTTVSDNKRDTTWVTSAEATAMGYLLYESYHAANANQPAYSQEEYIREPYPFFDETRNVHYTVYLDNNLDFYDWQLESIGSGTFNAKNTPFMGYFDGQMHTLTNLNMREEYLFKYIDAAAIRNLRIESTHKVSLVKEGTNTNYIVGIDLRAHSTRNPIAERLTSNQYNNPSYVVGCIHVGDAGGALVGACSNMYMFGCMQAAEGIPSGQGALLGAYLAYSSTSNWQFLEPRISFDWTNMSVTPKGTPTWGRFSCNYYDTELSPGTNAVANITDRYSPLEYIRGRESYILKAKNDNLIRGEATFGSLTSVQQRYAYYGLAPWKAMNYGIVRYNATTIGTTHPCNAHYENNSTGYVHRYPELVTGEPAATQYANPLEQNN